MRRAWFAMMLFAVALATSNVPSTAGSRGTSLHDSRAAWWDREEVTRDEGELADFHALLAQMDSAIAQGRVADIVRVNDRLHYAMHRELGQARGRIGSAAGVQESGAGGGIWAWALSRSVERRAGERGRERTAKHLEAMRSLIEQARPLEAPIRAGDTVAIRRNRELLGKFAEIMREDLISVASTGGGESQPQEQATR